MICIRPLSPELIDANIIRLRGFSFEVLGERVRVRGDSCFPGPLTLTLSPRVL